MTKMYQVQSSDAGQLYGVDHFINETSAQVYAAFCRRELGLNAAIREVEVSRATAKIIAFKPQR